ncbi:DUF418 domain-containing protein [Actinosynnema sp. NPDC047251]|uniref:Membrane protein n=1 Tax=Saccharothrix espanaensis (strain ATCC 51144 / DSM 44229 / JCM 9112 / NBRC 15066 / NRRL 15764) TaxID=1179773 RepID=K0JYY4_SACES|nr:DUF418 domain-containing protein [Saccharothrix espanaensis]CCH33155.1 membrane protein [Saccharothrix espanaensis DSM 44229]
MAKPERAARGAVKQKERALAPDFARGLMLLLIVLSNTVFYLWAAPQGPSGWHPVEDGTVDRAVQFLMIVVLDLRVYPLFAFLFGYGMMQLYLRQSAAGTPGRAALVLLSKRSVGLLVFGFAHAALLLAGDILGSYALAGVVLGWLFLRRGNRALAVWSGIAVAVLVLTSLVPALLAIAGGDLGPDQFTAGESTTAAYAAGEPDYLASMWTRLRTWSVVTFAGGLLSFAGHAAMLLGFLAARHRVLEEPHRHLTLLRWTAVLGVAVGWLGGLPAALGNLGYLDVPAAALTDTGALHGLQTGTGLAAGLGYVAIFALLANRMSDRAKRNPAVVAVTAVGKRSLSCYLAHSVLFAPVLAAWGLGLGEKLTSATMALFATAVWLVTVFGAYALERAGRRGPAEVVLRAVMYGRRKTDAPVANR